MKKIDRNTLLSMHGFLWEDVVKRFLSHRNQTQNKKSHLIGYSSDSSGVPQDSRIAPLLFNVYINDLVRNVEFSSKLLFGDDSKLFMEITSIKVCQKLLNDMISFLLCYTGISCGKREIKKN